MSTVVLIQAQPRLPSTGVAVDIRLAGGATKPYTQLGFADWRSGVANLPRFTTAIGFDQNGVTGGALPSTAGFRFYPSDRSYLSALGNLLWLGARITVAVGDDEDAAPVYRTNVLGTVSAVKTDGGAITLTFADLSVDLAKPLAPDIFAGTGDLEGGDAATGRVKRRSFGYVFNVEGRVLDAANNVYEFGDTGRPIASFERLKDKGNTGGMTVLPWQGTALATLNALRAATAPSGGGVAAPSIACVKWWTVPAGPLTADLRGEVGNGYVETAPAIAASIATALSPTIIVSNLAEAVGWQGAVAGVHVADANETASAVLDRLLLPLLMPWIISGAGVLSFRRFTWDGPVEKLLADTIAREETFQPLRTRRVGFQRNYRQHTDAEIAAVLLVATDATYVDGTPIEALKPAEAGANVTELRTAAALAGQGALATIDRVGYGTPYVTGFGGLSPLDSVSFNSPYLLEQTGGLAATLAAFKTALGQAASLYGQGPFATVTGGQSLDNPSLFNLTGRFIASRFGADYFEAGRIAFFGGNTAEGLKPGEPGANVTESRTAAAVTGQGPFATVPGGQSIDNVDLFSLPIRLLTLRNGDPRFLRADLILFDAGDGYGGNYSSVGSLRPAQFGSDVTRANSAAAIIGQGPLATSPITPNPAGAINASDIDNYGIGRLSQFWPAQAGADVTGVHTAASILGQGGLATAGTVNAGNVAQYFSFSAFSLNYSITRADGQSVVTESLAITAYGVAAAVAGQGRGATSNSLSDLDPGAAKSLANAAAASTTIRIGNGASATITRVVPAGGSVGVIANLRGTSNSAGSLAVQLQYALSPGAWGNLGSPGQASVGPGEPGTADAEQVYTNNTSTQQVVDFRAVGSGPSGYTPDLSMSYLTA